MPKLIVIKDFIVTISTLIGVVGGLCIGYKYFAQRKRFPKIELFIELKKICTIDNQKILESILTIQNSGLVRHKIDLKSFTLKIRFLKNIDKVKQGNQDINFQTHFTNKYSTSNNTDRFLMNLNDEYTYIDPQTKQTYSYVLNLPEEACAVLLKYEFLYVEKQSDKQTIQRVFKI